MSKIKAGVHQFIFFNPALSTHPNTTPSLFLESGHGFSGCMWKITAFITSFVFQPGCFCWGCMLRIKAGVHQIYDFSIRPCLLSLFVNGKGFHRAILSQPGPSCWGCMSKKKASIALACSQTGPGYWGCVSMIRFPLLCLLFNPALDVDFVGWS